MAASPGEAGRGSRFERRRRRNDNQPRGERGGGGRPQCRGRGEKQPFERRRQRNKETGRGAPHDDRTVRDRGESTTNNDEDDGGKTKDEEDVLSLSSWIGPLVANERDGDFRPYCTYNQDRDKRYPFFTDERGYDLLHCLMSTNVELLRINREMIEDCASAFALPDAATTTRVGVNANANFADDIVVSDIGDVNARDIIVRIGLGLYAHKPTMRTRGVTWSTEEYGHPGLQRMYLRMKPIQRFTEIWSLLERCEALGVFDGIFEGMGEGGGGGVVRIAAIRGGPGYELLATKLFFEDVHRRWIERRRRSERTGVGRERGGRAEATINRGGGSLGNECKFMEYILLIITLVFTFVRMPKD